MNTNLFKYILFFYTILFVSCHSKHAAQPNSLQNQAPMDSQNLSDIKSASPKIYPGGYVGITPFATYNFLIEFSNKLNSTTGLTLYGYGYNTYLPSNYKIINGIANFTVDYILSKPQQSMISLQEARKLLISVTEAFLQEVNSHPEISQKLDIYPFTSDFLRVAIYFQDENGIELGQGVSAMFLSRGKIEYEHYEIEEYKDPEHVKGKTWVIHQENYTEAFNIANKSESIQKNHHPDSGPARATRAAKKP